MPMKFSEWLAEQEEAKKDESEDDLKEDEAPAPNSTEGVDQSEKPITKKPQKRKSLEEEVLNKFSLNA